MTFLYQLCVQCYWFKWVRCHSCNRHHITWVYEERYLSFSLWWHVLYSHQFLISVVYLYSSSAFICQMQHILHPAVSQCGTPAGFYSLFQWSLINSHLSHQHTQNTHHVLVNTGRSGHELRLLKHFVTECCNAVPLTSSSLFWIIIISSGSAPSLP